MILIAFDVGLTGAIAAIDHRSAQVVDIPTTEDDNGKRIQGRLLITLLRQFIPPGEPFMAVMEDIRVRPTAGRMMSHKIETSLVRCRGVIEAVLDIAGCPSVQYVNPTVWKRAMGLLKAEKGQSLEIARRLFPGQAHNLLRQKDHNRAEALLLANYAARTSPISLGMSFAQSDRHAVIA